MRNQHYRVVPKSVDPKHQRLQELEKLFSELFFDEGSDYLTDPEKYEPLKEELKQLQKELDPDPFNFTDEELED